MPTICSAGRRSRGLRDVALVGLGSSSGHALELISEIVREASCPVITILHAGDPAYIHEAAKRGLFAYIIARLLMADLRGYQRRLRGDRSARAVKGRS